MSEKHPQAFLCRRIMVVKQSIGQLVFKTSSLPQGVLLRLLALKEVNRMQRFCTTWCRSNNILKKNKTGRKKGKAQGWVVMPLPPPEQQKRRFNRCCFKVLRWDWWGGSPGKGAQCQAWWPRINPQEHTVEGENWLPHTVLTFAHVRVHAHTHINKHNFLKNW